MKALSLILVLILSLQACKSDCSELELKDAVYFIETHGNEAIKAFSGINVEFDGGYIINYMIDRRIIKLEENPMIKEDSIYLRFNGNIRFFYEVDMTFEDFCEANDFKDSYYSLNYIHNNTFVEPEKEAFEIIRKLISDLYKFGLNEVEGKLMCPNNMRFYLISECKEYHVVSYVPDSSKIYPAFWRDFYKTQYVQVINDHWYYYIYQDMLDYSDYYNENNLNPGIDRNPCFGE